MRRKFMWVSVVLTGMLGGCNSNTINLAYNPSEHKVVLHPNKGDVIKWMGSKGPLAVDFPVGNPCKKDDPPGQCTISVDAAVVPYTCQDCTDPEIVVGSDIATPYGSAPGGTRPAAADIISPAYILCTGSQIGVYPAEVTIPRATVAAGASVAWQRGGIPPVGKDWKVDGFSSAICSNSPPFQEGNATCHLKPDLGAGTTTYNVALPSCSSTPLVGAKLTITP